MPFTKYVDNKMLDEMLGRTSSLDFGNVYLGLSKTTPVDDGTTTTFTEPSGNGYARVLVGNYQQPETLMFGAASNGSITNNKQIKFDMATGAWGECTHGLLLDSSGHVLAFAELGYYSGSTFVPDHISPVANSVPLIQVGGITFSLDRS